MRTKQMGRPKADPARDLRSALLIASRALLDAGGPAALSMREVSRRVACTHQAPYHYFASKEAIVAALVAEGFEALAVGLMQAKDKHATQGQRAVLVASGAAYVNFALAQPGVFRIMFRPDLCDAAQFPEVQASAQRARDALDQLGQLAFGRRARAARATLLWAHVHGLACLLLDGPLALQFVSKAQKHQHLRQVSVHFADLVLAHGKAIAKDAAP